MVATRAKKKYESKEQASVTWEEFQEEYLTREDAYRYEWIDGKVEQTFKDMNTNQLHILTNLLLFFSNLKQPGVLAPETDVFFAGKHRRPDIAYFSVEQVVAGAQGENVVPRFIIEVISTYDQSVKVYDKMKDYWAARVELVWHVFPALEQVHVFTHHHPKQMNIFEGDDILSASDIIEGFVLPAKQLFELPIPITTGFAVE